MTLLDFVIIIVLIVFAGAVVVILYQAWRAGQDLQKELDDIRESRKRGEQ